jgi:Rrf2 family iron-sulfur cluster assembly transcriptional regulator
LILSKPGEYGIQIALHLALRELRGDGGLQPVRELAQECGIPVHFLGKICYRLTKNGILISHKGPRGGVALARPASEIVAVDVVNAVDGLAGFTHCVLGLDRCDDDAPCPMHDHWKAVKQQILAMFERKSLAELASELDSGKLRHISLSAAAALAAATSVKRAD